MPGIVCPVPDRMSAIVIQGFDRLYSWFAIVDVIDGVIRARYIHCTVVDSVKSPGGQMRIRDITGI